MTTKKITSRQRRRLLREASTKLATPKPKSLVQEAKTKIGAMVKKLAGRTPDQAEDAEEETTSKRAIRYQPHRAKGARFLDTRRKPYIVTEEGSLRAIAKPPSRVRRQRAEREREAAQKAKTKTTKKAGQGRGTSAT